MSVVDEVHERNRPFPEMIRRADDAPIGQWTIDNVRAVRGEPKVAIKLLYMAVPLDDSEVSKAIRGHEMVHVKISPQDWRPYISDVTPDDALQSAEEIRVNYVAGKLGFPMKALLIGSERASGEFAAKAGDWRSAVMFTAACLHTGGLNSFITGVRSYDTGWADRLRDVAKELESFQNKQIKNLRKYHWEEESDILKLYTSTDVVNGLLKGMSHTIEMAMFIESIAALPAPELTGVGRTRKNSKEDKSDSAPASKVDDDSNEGVLPSTPPTEARKLRDEKSKLDREALQKRAEAILKDRISKVGLPDWEPVTLGNTELSVALRGFIARKKQPAMFGRQIKRPDRLVTDPKMRIFEQKRRVQGGVVLIDCSMSMKLSTKDVQEILEAAPGCTVIGYSSNHAANAPNTYVLADNGRMVERLPEFFLSNGNDLPALQFAVSKRGDRKNPVIWVTDGLVYRPGMRGEYSQRECALFAQSNKVHMVHSPDRAVLALKQLAAGGLRPQILPRWRKLIG